MVAIAIEFFSDKTLSASAGWEGLCIFRCLCCLRTARLASCQVSSFTAHTHTVHHCFLKQSFTCDGPGLCAVRHGPVALSFLLASWTIYVSPLWAMCRFFLLCRQQMVQLINRPAERGLNSPGEVVELSTFINRYKCEKNRGQLSLFLVAPALLLAGFTGVAGRG